MKIGLFAGFALAISGAFTAPAEAQDCAAILQEFEAVSAALSQRASAYWSERKVFIENASRGAADERTRIRSADAVKVKAMGAKAAIREPFARFVALANAAQAQKCLPEAEIKARREQIFDEARRVNFDQLPDKLETEGAPTAQKTPRMPVK